MKKIFFIVLGCFICSASFANVYVIYDSETNEVYSVSEKNDTVVPEGKVVAEIGGTIRQLGLSQNPCYYTYENGIFIVNNDKINEDLTAQAEYEKKQEELKKINEKAKKMAYEALVESGAEFEVITEKYFDTGEDEIANEKSEETTK